MDPCVIRYFVSPIPEDVLPLTRNYAENLDRDRDQATSSSSHYISFLYRFQTKPAAFMAYNI